MSKQKRRKKRIHDRNYNKPKLANEMRPVTEGQKEYVRNISENKVTFCFGPAGSGKSYCATGYACEKLVDESHPINTIIISTPVVSLGKKSMGSLPGPMEEKMSYYVSPIQKHIRHFLGEENHRKFLMEKKIIISPLEFMRGETFNNSFILLDEAQNADYTELKMFITRFGFNSKMVLNGDIEQTDLDYYEDEENDFARIVRWMENETNFASSQLEITDIVRDSAVSTFVNRVRVMEREEDFKG